MLVIITNQIIIGNVRFTTSDIVFILQVMQMVKILSLEYLYFNTIYNFQWLIKYLQLFQTSSAHS